MCAQGGKESAQEAKGVTGSLSLLYFPSPNHPFPQLILAIIASITANIFKHLSARPRVK